MGGKTPGHFFPHVKQSELADLITIFVGSKTSKNTIGGEATGQFRRSL